MGRITYELRIQLKFFYRRTEAQWNELMTRVLSLEDQHRNSLRNVQRTDLPFPKASFCLWTAIHWNLDKFRRTYRLSFCFLTEIDVTVKSGNSVTFSRQNLNFL